MYIDKENYEKIDINGKIHEFTLEKDLEIFMYNQNNILNEFIEISTQLFDSKFVHLAYFLDAKIICNTKSEKDICMAIKNPMVKKPASRLIIITTFFYYCW